MLVMRCSEPSIVKKKCTYNKWKKKQKLNSMEIQEAETIMNDSRKKETKDEGERKNTM